MNKVLKSWAITKEPPKDKSAKRLAIQVEDHPLSYANFHGEIKEGYGKGTVKIWDKGDFILEDKKPKKLVFQLKGKKLKGKYVLLKTAYGPKKNGWLFFKID
jgi:DNA ligase D-like protein (predicted 3'-phosphoesterase)